MYFREKNKHLNSFFSSASPPPDVHVRLQSKEEVGEQPLVHRGPLEFWDSEHSRAGAGTELTPLLVRHGHASETQVHPQVPIQLRCSSTVEGLRRGGPRLAGQRGFRCTFYWSNMNLIMESLTELHFPFTC